jgi:L-lactate dehydrogenase complex protein LldG
VTAREAILAAIGRAAVPPVALPDVSAELLAAASRKGRDQLEMPLVAPEPGDALVRRFCEALAQAGGTSVETEGLAALSIAPLEGASRRGIVSCVPGLPISTLNIGPEAPRERLDEIGVAIVPARFGVAENGAVWVDERDLPHRAVPFIAEHLVVVLPKREIVADLHEAYRRLRPPLPGYGVLIAGPSKTADIEQALVIGAQGPKSVKVLLT